MATYDTSAPAELLTGMRLARQAIGRGELVVIPTDTVYGVAADAFSPAAVQRLLDAKGRDRTAPPPVLIPGIPTLDALAEVVPDEVRALVAEFWPGGLTVILRARRTLDWDLGETRGTVALRMPSDRSPSSCSPRPARSRCRAPTPPASRRPRPRPRPRRCWGMPWPSTWMPARWERYAGRPRAGSTIVDATGLEAPERQAAHRAQRRHPRRRDHPRSWGPTDAHSLLPARRRGLGAWSPSGSPVLICKLSHRYRLYPQDPRARRAHPPDAAARRRRDVPRDRRGVRGRIAAAPARTWSTRVRARSWPSSAPRCSSC